MSLRDEGEELSMDIAFWYQGLSNRDYPLGSLGDLCSQLSFKFRSIAIMALLVEADTDLFYHNLIRSAKVRESYLLRMKDEAIDKDYDIASGRYEPVLDAMAAGDLELARTIARLSPKTWQQEYEYEDDYCYAQILHGLIQDNPPQDEFLPILEQFEKVLEAESARFNLSKALVDKNQSDFDEGFDLLLEEREIEIKEEEKRGKLEDPVALAQTYIFVEGLAILRLAEIRGLKTQPEYELCPSLARVPMITPFPGE
jgi:hypothetical protein